MDIWFSACLFAGLVIWAWAMDRRIARIDRKLTALLVQSGARGDELPAPSDAVRALAADPRTKIAAIAAYRQDTGLGLVEAKEAVEILAKAGTNGGAKS
jgi:ribosomal protein L7/L12